MMRTLTQYFSLIMRLSLLTCLLISSHVFAGIFGYSGDGEYESEGIFLRNQLLSLPVFSLDEVEEYTYTIEGFAKNQSLYLYVEAEEAIPFWQVSTLLEIEIREKRSGKIVFTNRTRLNSHYERMLQAGKALRAEDEWEGGYRFRDPKIELRAVSFSNEEYPINQKKIEYFSSGPSPLGIKWYRDYLVHVKVVRPDEKYKNLKAHIMLLKGWK